ncbi:MAG: hypothetical protein LWW95_08270 [Candidatus Desulfofervidus auxilii]|nr:hypothetical protein [Candidatus Desulfofervidus auxilii]
MIKLTNLYQKHNLFIFRDFKTGPKVLTVSQLGYSIVRMGTLRGVELPHSKHIDKYMIKRNNLFHGLVPFPLASGFAYGDNAIDVSHEINDVTDIFPCSLKALFLNPFFVSILGSCRFWLLKGEK